MGTPDLVLVLYARRSGRKKEEREGRGGAEQVRAAVKERGIKGFEVLRLGLGFRKVWR